MMILTGPTGVGKSKMALRLAGELGLEILSFDSMLVYRGLDIGTDKPSSAELGRVKHHLIDVAEPEEDFDVAKFLRELAMVMEGNRRPLLGAGGTPYYIHTFLAGLPSFPDGRAFEAALSGMESSRLHSWLSRLDPARAAVVHEHDRFRTIRALSIILGTGRRASSFRPEKNAPLPEKRISLVGLDMKRELLHKRMEQRIGRMFESGLYEEARRLHSRRIGRTAAAAVGYKELFSHFNGELSLEQAKERILINTRKLLRKQITWLRKLPVQWIEVIPGEEELSYLKLKALAEEFYRNRTVADCRG